MQFEYQQSSSEPLPDLRKPKYLSYTALKLFEAVPDEFFLRYLSPSRPERPPQMPYMAVGSAFDALIKNRIHVDVYGFEATKGTAYELPTIVEAQVDEEFRSIVMPIAEDLYEQYLDCGAYQSLLSDIQGSTQLGMEFTITGEVGGVPLLGKPDLRFITDAGLHLIVDWKCNGSMSKTGASPQVGYRMCHDYGSNTNGKADKRFVGQQVGSMTISSVPMDQTTDFWAEQLAMYAWLCGEPVGSQEFVVRIEQIACRPVKTRDLPRAKFCQHVARVSAEAQQKLLERLQACWRACETGHVFQELSMEENNNRLLLLASKPIDYSQVFNTEGLE